MDLKKGENYIAYKFHNPLESLKLKLLNEEDLFFEAQVEEGFDNLDLWKTYIITLPNNFNSQKFLEVSPYKTDKENKTARFVILGYLLERRKFYRFNVEELNIPVESEYFEGTVENISLGGMKIKINRWKNRNLKEGNEVYVKTRVGDKEYHFIIKPVKVTDTFIAAKFEKPAKVTSDFFYHTLQLLNRQKIPFNERRNFRRFIVEPLNIIVDTPFGVGVLHDISLGGLKIKLKRKYKVDPKNLQNEFLISCFIPQTGEEYILNVRPLSAKGNCLNLRVTKWEEDALKCISRILELLVTSSPH